MTAVSAKALRRGHLPSGKQDEKLLTTVAMLKERGIALLSLEERIDTNSAAGELVFHFFGAILHFERRLIAERKRMELPPPVRRASSRAGPSTACGCPICDGPLLLQRVCSGASSSGCKARRCGQTMRGLSGRRPGGT